MSPGPDGTRSAGRLQPPPVRDGPSQVDDRLAALLAESWETVLQVGLFLGTVLVLLLASRIALQPAVERVIRRRNRNNPTLQQALFRYVRLLTVVVAVLVGAGVAGYGRFLTNSALIISAAALGIGVAAQEVIGSLVSGIALVLDPEFNVGDHVEWSGGQGVVRAVALRVTRVETQGGELITVPNTIFTSQEITRPYGHGNYRIVQTIGLGYETDLEAAMELLEEAAAGVDDILEEPAPAVFVDEFGDDAVIVDVHYWIEDPDRRDVFDVRSRFARSVKTAMQDADVEFSPPSEHALQGRLHVDRTD